MNLYLVKLLKKIRKKNYRNFLFNKKDEKIFISERKKFFKEYINNKEFEIEKKSKLNTTKIQLEKIYKKKILNILNKKYILFLIKKYEYNLKIKEMYNSNFLKTTNKNANNQTVAILALCLIKYKILNRLSTLNFILKFNDNLYLNFYRTRKSLNSKITSKIFDYEKKNIKFFYNIK